MKSSLRLQYEAQVKVIRQQIGELEGFRQELGLSQRKMAQLLLVDPSAWTRWTKMGEKAPPHIWRALQWYSALREKIPGLTPAYFLSADPRVLHEKALSKVDDEKKAREKLREDLEVRIDHLRAETKGLRKWNFVWGAAAAFFFLLSVLLLSRTARADEGEEAESRHLIPIAYYTPETSLAAGFLGIQNFGAPREGRTSSLTALGALTLNGQSFISLTPRFYPAGSKDDILGSFKTQYWPDYYYGRGLTTTVSEEDREKFDEVDWLASLTHGWNFRDDWKLRYGGLFERRDIVGSPAKGVTQAEIDQAGDKLETLGGILGLEWDQRDYPQAPKNGAWHRLLLTEYFPRDLSSRGRLDLKRFAKVDLDFRTYKAVRASSVWANQLSFSEVAGDFIPFQYLNTVGGDERLRGFYEGRFRERALALYQTEWREEIHRRYVVTGSVAAGRLASTLSQVPSAQTLWSGDLGLQYIVDQGNRAKIRGDIGFGQGPAIYLVMDEAF